MRYEFLDEQSRKVKDFAQTLLDENVVLVSVHYIFVQSYSNLLDIIQQQQHEPTSLPQKVKTILECSLRKQEVCKKDAIHLQSKLFSFSGQVIATGSKVTSLRPGDMVACVRFGQIHYTDLVCVSEYDAVLIHDKKNSIKASVTGFALLAMHAINRAKLRVGDYVCIGKFDAFGYILMSLAKLSGATVIVVDDDEKHLEFARASGVSFCFNTNEADWEKEVLCITQQHGVDVTIVTDSNTLGFDSQRIIEITRSHGRIVLVGIHDIHVDHAVLGRKDIDFFVASSFDTCPHDELYEQHNTIVPFVKWKQRVSMQKVLRLIEHKEFDCEKLTSCCIDMANITKECPYNTLQTGLGFVVSLLSQPASTLLSQGKLQKKHVQKSRFMPAVRDSVRVGIIGADSFVQHILMPTLVRIGDITINAIVDIEHARATRLSNLFGVARTCVMDTELLQEDLVDAVVIAANTLFQADRVISALEQRKAVFVKEPIASTFEQYNRLHTILNTYPDVPLCVDYHRSFSPFIRKIKEAIDKRSTPLMMRYRVNACTSRRCNDKENAKVGSVVGEACHFIDMFCYLTDAHPVAVSVEAIHAMRDDVFPTDNFSVQVSFDDGSVCSLVYTSLGHERFSGEHLELFFDSKAIVMNDFLTLTGYGLSSWFNEIVSVADIGREYLINQFFAGLRENPIAVPMSRKRILDVVHITLIIDQLACAGGGSKQLT